MRLTEKIKHPLPTMVNNIPFNKMRHGQGHGLKLRKALLSLIVLLTLVLLSSCSDPNNGQKDDYYFYNNGQKISCIYTSTGYPFSSSTQIDYCANTTGDFYTNQVGGTFLCKDHHSSTCNLQKSEDNWAPPYTYRQIGILTSGLFAFLVLFCTSSLARGIYFIIQVCSYLIGWLVSFLLGSDLGANTVMSLYIECYIVIDVFVLLAFFSLITKHFFGKTWYNKFALFAEIMAILGTVLVTFLGWLLATA